MNRRTTTIVPILLLLGLGSLTALPQAAHPGESAATKDQDVIDMTREIMPRVAELRGLEWEFEPGIGVYSEEELREMLMNDEETQEELQQADDLSDVLHAMGLVPEGFDVAEAMLDLYGGSIAGFYDPRTRELNLVRGGEPTAQERMEDMMLRGMYGISRDQMVMAHELTHALDDQHLDLLNMVALDEMSSDAILARTCLVEGTATSIQYDFMLQRQGTPSYESPMVQQMIDSRPGKEALPTETGLPNCMVQQILLPYAMGNRLVFEMRRRANGGWDEVNAAFGDALPASSEQILHPEKYLDERDDPTVLVIDEELAGRIGEGWREIDRDTLGEFFLWCYFEEMFSNRRSIERVARETAEGWDGDQFIFFKHDESGEVAMVATSTWDTVDDAREFFQLYRNLLREKYEGDAPAPGDGTTEYAFSTGDGTRVMLVRDGANVSMVENAPEDKADMMLEAAVNAERRQWTRPARGTEVRPGSPDGPIESDNWDGTHYQGNGFDATMPRDGFDLLAESEAALVFQAPERDRDQFVRIERLGAGAIASFQETAAFDEYVGGIEAEYSSGRFVVPGRLDRSAQPILRVVYGGRDSQERSRVTVAFLVEREGEIVAIRIDAGKPFLGEIADDAVVIERSLALGSGDEDGE